MQQRPSGQPVESGAVSLADRLTSAVRAVPDFPRAGIIFRDISPVVGDPGLFHDAVSAMADGCRRHSADVVVGIESRGFVLGGAVAYALGAGFVPVRKQGRLPTRTESVSYALEYGEAVLEIQADAIAPGQRVLVIDDLLATGGTASATIALVERLGGSVVCLSFLIELADLNGAAALGGREHSSLVTL
jgi:adenine phosphoribosyltransferase